MAELTPQQLQQFQKDLAKLNTLKRQLGEKPIRIEASADNLDLLNKALERTEDLVDNLNDGAQGLATSFRNIVSEITKANEGYKLGMGSLNKLKDISDKLRFNQRGISELSSADLRSLQRKQKLETENLNLAKKLLSEELKSSELKGEELEKTQKAYNEINNLLEDGNTALKQQNDLLAIQEKRTRNIEKGTGLTGAALKGLQGITGKLGLDGLSQAFEDASDAAKNTVSRLTDGGKKSAGLITKTRALGSAFKVVGKEILRNLVDPLVLGGLAIKGLQSAFNFVKKGYEEGKIAAERISNENTNIARSLGLAQGAASKLAGSVAGIGPTIAASKEAINGLYSALGSTEKLSNNTLKVFVKLSTFAGMSADSLASFQKFAKLSGQDAGVLVTNMAQTALETIKTNKFAFSQKSLLNDVANVSSVIRLRFRDQPKALVESVAKAKALGIEMNKIEDIASSLLNFEDSIAAEMEAELLTGKQLNLEKAREAALAGDTATLQSEIASQLGSIEEFNRMNVIQQEAFAKSIGLSRSELAGMLDAQKGNLSTQGDLVDGQQDGLKAMMSGVSEAEKNANLERSRQEASLKYYTTLAPLVQTLQDTFNKLKETLTGLFTDLVVKPMVDWVSSPAGKEFIDSLPEKAEKFANGIRNAAKVAKTAFEGITTFIKENPVLSKTIGLVAGGSLLVKGGMSLFGLGKKDGSSENLAFFVKLAGGARGAADSVKDMFRSKKPTIKEGTDKLGRKFKYDTATGKRISMNTPSSKGGSFFGKIGSGLKSTAGSVGKAVSGINPLSALKKGLVSNAGKFIGKAAKGGLIGALFNVGNLAAIMAGEGTSQQKAEQIIPLAASILGGALGGVAGSIVGPVGTFAVGALGSIIGDYIGNTPAIQKALAPPLAKVLGGDDVAEDFIMQGGKIQKFRKDDIVIGGTNLPGSDPKMIQLLTRLVNATEKGSIIMLDGQRVGQALSTDARRLQ
jgi:hypothetical protein